jgi:poly-beta-1,6-N-acetyl-D-glucosamine synthase
MKTEKRVNESAIPLMLSSGRKNLRLERAISDRRAWGIHCGSAEKTPKSLAKTLFSRLSEDALVMRFTRHGGIFRPACVLPSTQPGAGSAFRSVRGQVIGHAGKIMPSPSVAMSSGRLFLDRDARQQSPSLLHRHAQCKTIAASNQSNYHRTVTSLLTGCLSPGAHFIIPAHNEELVIREKLENTLKACRATGISWQVIVVSDASTDRTVEICRSCHGEVQTVELSSRAGIVGAFRAGLTLARGEIVVFSDADILLTADTLGWLLRGFADPTVGGVCGRAGMVVQGGSGLGAEKINVFLRSWVRKKQSDLYSSIGADGANWAIRRHLIRLPDKALLGDDLVIPLEVIHQGFRYLYEPQAKALEVSPSSVEYEFKRKVRTIRGGLQAALQCRWMFSRRFWPAGFHYLSWKIAKYLVPAWAIVFTLSVAMLSLTMPVFRLVLAVEIFAMLLIIASAVIRIFARGLIFGLASAVWYLFAANLAALIAVFQTLVTQNQSGAWAAAPRAVAKGSTTGPSPGR